jgi:hypothetical protein
MSAVSEESFTHPPALSEHTEETLGQLLGYAPERIAGARERKIIWAVLR